MKELEFRKELKNNPRLTHLSINDHRSDHRQPEEWSWYQNMDVWQNWNKKLLYGFSDSFLYLVKFNNIWMINFFQYGDLSLQTL